MHLGMSSAQCWAGLLRAVSISFGYVARIIGEYRIQQDSRGSGDYDTRVPDPGTDGGFRDLRSRAAVDRA